MQSNEVGRKPTPVEIELLAELRKKGAELRELLDRIGTHVDEQHQHAQSSRDLDEMERLQEADPLRWHADAKHSLQAGIMQATRAISQPSEF